MRKAGLAVPHMYLPSPNHKSIVVSLTKLSAVVFSSMSYELTSRIRNIVELVKGHKLHKRSFYCLMFKFRDLIENDPRISAWKNEPPRDPKQEF